MSAGHPPPRDPYRLAQRPQPDAEPRCGVCDRPSRYAVCGRCQAEVDRRQLLAQLSAERFAGVGL